MTFYHNRLRACSATHLHQKDPSLCSLRTLPGRLNHQSACAAGSAQAVIPLLASPPAQLSSEVGAATIAVGQAEKYFKFDENKQKYLLHELHEHITFLKQHHIIFGRCDPTQPASERLRSGTIDRQTPCRHDQNVPMLWEVPRWSLAAGRYDVDCKSV